MYYFYSIDFWNECTEGSETQQGFLRAETYSEALKLIAYDYGEECLESVLIKCTDIDTNCIELGELNEYIQDGLEDNLKLSNENNAK